jgi:hypothetical protein
MVKIDFPNSEPPGADQTLANITGLPEQLPGDPRRQAVSSIMGTVYQAWWSIDAWLCLTDADEVIYLEGAEDFDVVRNEGGITVQVKHTAGSISLGSYKAHTALENFWTLSCQTLHRRIEFHYLTTSSIAMEQDACFGGATGIRVWRSAQTNPDLAAEVSKYLIAKLEASSPLRTFLISATPDLVQARLIQRFHWLTDQPDVDVVKRSVENRIAVLLYDKRLPLALVPNVQKYLESRFWEILIEPSSARRCLNRGELLRQLEAATTTYIPVPTGQLPSLVGNFRPGLGLLNLLLGKLPMPPEPLLHRPELTQRLVELIRHRKTVLLTGSVYKGKTTVAQLVSSALCPEAWWVNLTERRSEEVDNVLLALADRVESNECPSLVVIDDLDISPAAHRVYRDSLALIMHRGSARGRGVILTARGTSSDSARVMDFRSLEILEVPELSCREIEALCVEHGCPPELATTWGSLVTAFTRGHPKLVQVRLAELAARGWPGPGATDLLTPSSAVTSARQMARHLLNHTVSDSVAEFVYLASVCSVPMHRSVAIRLAETVDALINGGDVVDDLTGKWLERIKGNWFRTTALLDGAANDVWSPERLKQAHIRIHDAILAKHPLEPSEAAALLLHAYIGGEPRRLVDTAMRLYLIDGEDARREVQRQLLWLPFVALEVGQSITDDAMAGTILRNLQFQVALTLDTDSLPQICARWADNIERILHPDARSLNRALMWFANGFAESRKVPLKSRLDAIIGIPTLTGEMLKAASDLGKQFFEIVDVEDGMPHTGSTTQAIFLCACRSFRGLSNLVELLQWLDKVATEEIRHQFDTMLEWPLIQTLGAFVQSAWAAVHEETKDWEPWLVLFERVDEYARRRSSPRFGREAAKAKAIILAEYLERDQEALKLLDLAEDLFGPSVVLMEVRTNVLFHAQDDSSVLQVWSQLTSDPVTRATLDPFAYRRAAMSAARLRRMDEAGEIFRAGGDSLRPGFLDVVKFGLYVDAALAIALGGKQAAASRLLAFAVLSLPREASTEGNERWEAVQRIAVVACRFIEKSVWNPTEVDRELEPGRASSPDLKVPKIEPGQAARTEMTRVQIYKLTSTLVANPPGIAQELEALKGSRYVFVRWVAAEARLALAYGTGAGSGFIEAILAFDTAMADLSAKKKLNLSPLDPDDGLESIVSLSPEKWFGLLCAGAICAGTHLLSHLNNWLDASRQILGDKAALTDNIRLLFEGASLPIESLDPTIIDAASPSALRCGAAARMLLERPSPEKTLHMQAFLTSGLVSDVSFASQELFNLHVARRFADAWREIADNSRFHFYSPRTSVPALLHTLDNIEKGSGTLKSLIIVAAHSLRQAVGEFIDRVL